MASHQIPIKQKKQNFYDALLQLQTIQNITINSTDIPTQNMKLRLQQPRNLTMHNLCHDTQPPIDVQNLLGLGLKYCVVPPKPSYNIKECLKKMAYWIRTKQYLLAKKTQSKTE